MFSYIRFRKTHSSSRALPPVSGLRAILCCHRSHADSPYLLLLGRHFLCYGILELKVAFVLECERGTFACVDNHGPKVDVANW